MQKRLVMTITGNDRIGIVEEVTKIILTHEGNVEASRMARLGGEFAMLMLVSVTDKQFAELQAGIKELRNRGFEVATRPTERGFAAQNFAGWHHCQIHVNGADHEGIIHEITHYLTQQGISLEAVDTGLREAPFGGGVLFMMTATAVVPPNLLLDDLQDELEAIGDQLNVGVLVEQLDN